VARALNDTGVPVPSGRGVWTHTTVARVLARTNTEYQAGLAFASPA
jgi:hypothetical protein